MSEELDGLFETLENDLLSKYEYNLLLNYITNLQKENEKLKDELKYTIPQVEHNQIVSKLCREKQDYKSRNEKAIEYIKRKKLVTTEVTNGNIIYLLNILKGGDE